MLLQQEKQYWELLPAVDAHCRTKMRGREAVLLSLLLSLEQPDPKRWME